MELILATTVENRCTHSTKNGQEKVTGEKEHVTTRAK